MKILLIIAVCFYFTIYECHVVHSQLTLTEEMKVMIGNDRDGNDCIASAGYEWCNTTKSCSRPWEITCLDCDVFDCLSFHGYEWCNVTLRCQNKMYSSCPGQWEIGIIGAEMDEYGCCKTCGERWCSESNSCVGERIPCPYDCYY